jgi:hypothetical protein
MFGTHSDNVKLRKEKTTLYEEARITETTIKKHGFVTGYVYFTLPDDVVSLNDATLSLWFIDPTVANGVRKEVTLAGIRYVRPMRQ